MIDIDFFIVTMTLVATATLAVSGVFQATRHQFDLFGVLVLAFVTSVGGGTLRDVLLDAEVFWVIDYVYIPVIVITALIAFFVDLKIPRGRGIRVQILEYMDAMGLALFTVLGVQKALSMGMHGIVAVIMGIITGVVGGMIRDLLCNEQPTVLKADIYATLSLAGGFLYVIMKDYLEQNLAMFIVMSFIFVSRIIVLLFKFRRPKTI